MNPTHRPSFVTTAVAALACTTTIASAGLVGDTVSIWSRAQLNGETTLQAFAVVQDPGYEYSVSILDDTLFTLDIGPASIRLDSLSNWYSPWFNSGFAPTAIEIRDMDFGPGLSITGVEVSYASSIVRHDSAPIDLPAFSADNISFNGDTVRITYGGHEFFEASWVQIDLIVTPAPASLGLLLAAGVLTGRRR